VWAASDTLRIGDLLVGVRSDPAPFSKRIRTMLAAHLVEGLDAPPNYSIRLETREPGRKAPAHGYVLYRSQCLLLRTRRRERVLRALMTSLSGHVEPLDGLLRVRQLAVIGRSGAVILPNELFWRLEALEPRLGEHGVRLVEPPFVDIDAGTGDLILAPPTMDVDPAKTGRGWPGFASADGHARSRHPIVEWTFLGPDDGPLTPHAALGVVMPLLHEGSQSSSVALEVVLRTLARAKLQHIGRERSSRLLERIVASIR
jgi:hypothetical protein